MIHPNQLARSGTEHGEQVALFAWAAWQQYHGPAEAGELAFLFAVKNAGHGDAIRGAMAKAEGVKKGVSDMFLPVPRHGKAGLWIELKKRKGGTESQEQKDWGEAMRERGYAYLVARGWREASSALTMWLGFDEASWSDGVDYI
jgi:hypothetical protein